MQQENGVLRDAAGLVFIPCVFDGCWVVFLFRTHAGLNQVSQRSAAKQSSPTKGSPGKRKRNVEDAGDCSACASRFPISGFKSLGLQVKGFLGQEADAEVLFVITTYSRAARHPFCCSWLLVVAASRSQITTGILTSWDAQNLSVAPIGRSGGMLQSRMSVWPFRTQTHCSAQLHGGLSRDHCMEDQQSFRVGLQSAVDGKQFRNLRVGWGRAQDISSRERCSEGWKCLVGSHGKSFGFTLANSARHAALVISLKKFTSVPVLEALQRFVGHAEDVEKFYPTAA